MVERSYWKVILKGDPKKSHKEILINLPKNREINKTQTYIPFWPPPNPMVERSSKDTLNKSHKEILINLPKNREIMQNQTYIPFWHPPESDVERSYWKVILKGDPKKCHKEILINLPIFREIMQNQTYISPPEPEGWKVLKRYSKENVTKKYW
jgi:hypothetical protein